MAEIPRRPEASKRTRRVNRPRFEPIGKYGWKTDSASRYSVKVILVRIYHRKYGNIHSRAYSGHVLRFPHVTGMVAMI